MYNSFNQEHQKIIIRSKMVEDENFIFKWRVKAMLKNIKHIIENEPQVDIASVIDSYLKFTDEVGSEYRNH